MNSTYSKLSSLTLAIGAALLAAQLAGCNRDAGPAPAVSSPTEGAETAAAEPAALPSNPDREAFFGQTHLHTSWSPDAYVIGNTLSGPEEAYRYAMGESIKHPAGYEVQLKRPLDFQGVTDHSEYMGMLQKANDPNSPISKTPSAAKLKVNSPADVVPVFQYLAGKLGRGEKIEDLLSPDAIGEVWQNVIAVADKFNKPGKFTTFVAYEWTAAPDARNMHRNIFFRDSKHLPAAPFTAIDSQVPEDLWDWMDAQRKQGGDLLAISHNANLSDGRMFPTDVDGRGRPIDAAWARQRMENEPLTEAKQIKGTSETTPSLSPDDEFADYELMNFRLGRDTGTNQPHGSYFREAYGSGIAMQARGGYNPYKFGVVAAGDSHNTVVSYTQDRFSGGHGMMDATPEARLAGRVESGMETLKTGTSGLAGVWAEQNTREAIFDAMRRKEVYGTSGTRIKVRLFGGWAYPDNALEATDWVQRSYRDGVPMGGDLKPKAGDAPTFIVWATKDPDDASLDRVQIIKSWVKDGEISEQVYDVAWSGERAPGEDGKVPAVANTVDLAKATYSNDFGAVELKKVWRDPSFDPALHAVYYARVLQIPTPRWSTYDAVKLGRPLPEGVAPTVQERAWTSPIWYSPVAPTPGP